MSQTNGVCREAPTIAAMIEAMYKVERESYKPLAEFRIHPDDWDEIRKEAKPHLINPAGLERNLFSGVPIVLDRTVARLSRKEISE